MRWEIIRGKTRKKRCRNEENKVNKREERKEEKTRDDKGKRIT